MQATNQRIVAVDSQKIESISSCGRLHDYKYVNNLVPIITPDYMERGSLIHEMLSVYYKLKKYKSRWRANGKSYQDIIQSCIKAGRHHGNKMQLAISEIEYTIDIFQQYVDLWENDGWDNI